MMNHLAAGTRAADELVQVLSVTIVIVELRRSGSSPPTRALGSVILEGEASNGIVPEHKPGSVESIA